MQAGPNTSALQMEPLSAHTGSTSASAQTLTRQFCLSIWQSQILWHALEKHPRGAEVEHISLQAVGTTIMLFSPATLQAVFQTEEVHVTQKTK